jgi:hypothetical protein
MHIVIWPAFPQSSNLARGFFLPDPVASTLRNSKKEKNPQPPYYSIPSQLLFPSRELAREARGLE